MGMRGESNEVKEVNEWMEINLEWVTGDDKSSTVWFPPEFAELLTRRLTIRNETEKMDLFVFREKS